MAFGFPKVDGWLLFFELLLLWTVLLFILVRTGWLGRLGMSLFGPALMIKTQRGRGLLDWFARARGFFINSATVGLALTALVMAAMTVLLIIQVPLLFRLPVEAAPSPRLLLGIPGFNPLIPIGWGIIALVFAVAVHEFSHGILARAQDLKVKTMGILLLIIPVGAFVEPDEEELKRASRIKRLRVFSAGPLSNLVFAALFAVIFSTTLIGAAKPVEGAVIGGVEVDPRGPACAAGILPGWVITAFQGPNDTAPQKVSNWEELSPKLRAAGPNVTVRLTILDATIPEKLRTHTCANATAAAGGVFSVTTRRCSEQYGNATCKAEPTADNPDPLNRTVIGVKPYAHEVIYGLLRNPVQSLPAFVNYLGLPFYSLTGQFPLASPYTDYYETPFDGTWFWQLANLLFWLSWINLMLGLTNALPMVPLDGGHMFRDFVGAWVDRKKASDSAARTLMLTGIAGLVIGIAFGYLAALDLSLTVALAIPGLCVIVLGLVELGRRRATTPEAREVLVRRVSNRVALFLLALILLQFVAPYIASLARGAG